MRPISNNISKVISIIVVFALISLVNCPIGLSQSGTNDLSFNPSDFGYGYGDGGNGAVLDAVTQADGKIIVFGSFTTYHGVYRNKIARLNSDGSLDTTFNPGYGANDYIRYCIIQGDGKIIVAGEFTSFNSTSCNRIVRLNSDGSIDNTFVSGTAANNKIWTMEELSSGKILISGLFTEYDGNACIKLARINSDGSFDNTFNPGTSSNNMIYDLEVDSNEKIIIGGAFTSYDGNSCNRIARLNSDGSYDATYNVGFGANSLINSVSIASDDKVIIGGMFSTYNSTSVTRIARINTDGSLDITFDPGLGPNEQVRSTFIRSDGKILIAGDFSSYNSIDANYYALLNEDGSLNTEFNLTTGASQNVYNAKVHVDGKIFLTGIFTAVNDTSRTNIARLNFDGSIDQSFYQNTGANSLVYSSALQEDGKIIIGGDFSMYNGSTKNCLARINDDGSVDESFNSGLCAIYGVRTIKIQNPDKILVGGSFSEDNGSNCNFITRLNNDGSIDDTFNSGTGAIGSVYTMAVQEDGKVLLGGNINQYDGISCSYIMRVNSDGSFDNTFDVGYGAGGTVFSIEIQDDGKIFVGGVFTFFNGTIINRIVRLNTDGSIDTTFNPGTGADNTVYDIEIQDDGKLIVAGDFNSFNGSAYRGIVRLNSDGSIDNTFDPGYGTVGVIHAVVSQLDGKIIAGGSFSAFGGVSRNNIHRLNSNGSFDNSFVIGNGANDDVYTIQDLDNAKILIGGRFTEYNGVGRNRITKLDNCFNSFDTIPESVCDSYTSPSGNYTWSSSGIYLDTIPNFVGCDSIITINLLVGNTSSVLNPIVCESYTSPSGNNTWAESGVYYDTIPNLAGCDSIITINLFVSTLDFTISVTDNILTSNESFAYFQWVDCNNDFAIIPDEEDQSFVPEEDGSYAVILDDEICVDTTDCIEIVGLENPIRDINILLYPNPVSNELIIEFGDITEKLNFEIQNSLGQIVFKGQLLGKTLVHTDKFSPGFYIIRLENGMNYKFRKI